MIFVKKYMEKEKEEKRIVFCREYKLLKKKKIKFLKVLSEKRYSYKEIYKLAYNKCMAEDFE